MHCLWNKMFYVNRIFCFRAARIQELGKPGRQTPIVCGFPEKSVIIPCKLVDFTVCVIGNPLANSFCCPVTKDT